MVTEEIKQEKREYGPKDHMLTARWYPGEDGKPRFEIECACGKTRFKATIPNMKQPEVEDYMGLDLLTFKNDDREYKLRKSLPRQLEQIAACRHQDRFTDCPAIEELVRETAPGKKSRRPDIKTTTT